MVIVLIKKVALWLSRTYISQKKGDESWRGGVRKVLAIEGKTFELSLEDGLNGWYLRIVERSRGFVRSVFLEKAGASRLARWIRGLQSSVVVDGLGEKWEGKFRSVSRFGKSNSFGKFLRVVEVPYDRAATAIIVPEGVFGKLNSFGMFLRVVEVPYDRAAAAIIVPEGVRGSGWFAFASAIEEVLGKYHQRLRRFEPQVRVEGGRDERSYKQAATVAELPLEIGCEVRWRNGLPVCVPARDGVDKRMKFLRACLLGRRFSGLGDLQSVQRKVSKE